MQRILIHILIIILSCCGNLLGSGSYQPDVVNPLTESWRWTHFAEVEGKGIRYIVEDKNKNIWVSSNEGLLEYDGYQWKLHEELNDIISAPPEQILVTEDQGIYITTSHGIYFYKDNQWTSFFTLPEDQSFIFTQIKQLLDGSIIACSDNGAIHFQKDKTDFYTSPIRKKELENDLPNVNWILLPDECLIDGAFLEITDIMQIDKMFWFAITPKLEEGKVLIFDPSIVHNPFLTEYHIIHDTPAYPIGDGQQFLLSQENEVWLINLSTNKGVTILSTEGKPKKRINVSSKFSGDNYMSDILQSEDGTIWISGMARMFSYTDGAWDIYRSPDYPVPANRVILQASQDEKLWIAGYKSKMLLLDFSSKDQITYKNLSFQCEDRHQNEWFISIDNKVIKHHNDTWISYDSQDGLMDAPIGLIQTSKDQIWVAGSHKGKAATALYSDGKWLLKLHPELSWGIDYRSMLESKDGSIWFGGSVDAEKKDGYFSGLVQVIDPSSSNPKWIHHKYGDNGLDQTSIYGVGQSPDGRIWIGGTKLNGFDGEKWASVPDERLNQYVNVVSSTDDLLLVGSRYYGLFLYDGKSWTNYNTSHGLSSNTIISIDALSPDQIYVSTDNGICRFDGISWTQNVFPEKFNMDFEGGSIAHSDDETLWINHVPRSWKRRAFQSNTDATDDRGFFTSKLPITDAPPETMIDFYIESISPEGNSFVSWSGADFYNKTSNERLSYSYRLDDDEWSPFTEQQQFTFTSLNSGDHTLEVRARDLDFNIDPTPARIEFEVLPPLWKQAWFILLIAGFLTTFGVYEYRVISKKRKLEALNGALQKSNIDLIKGREMIEQQNEKILEQSYALEQNNRDLESRNIEVRSQRDLLEEMVVKVENLSKAKVGFFTNISHELRTPLTLILGPAQQLLNKDNIAKDEKQRLYRTIHKNASRLLKLINQLLEMRRIEQSSLELKLSNINLSQFMNEIVSLFEVLAIKKDVLLTVSSGLSHSVMTLDADKIEKILVNLLSNAFKHTPEGGSISLTVEEVSDSHEQLSPYYDQYIKLSVEDTGEGINQEEIDRIFDKYFTKDSLNDADNNSGIGLSYVRDLIYLMQGEIRVSSAPNQGTRFDVYLPLVVADEQQLSAISQPLRIAEQEVFMLINNLSEEELNNKNKKEKLLPKVLVVDDNREMLHFIQTILQEHHDIMTAPNGQVALKMAHNQNFDLIISDVIMPEMDGYSFCEKIKSNIATSHIPVILLTAKIMEDHMKTGYQSGADDYITKPFNPEILSIRVQNLLQQRKQLREAFNKEFMLTPNTETIVSQDEILLQKIVDMMEKHIDDASFNVDKMCKMAHLSHMHFIRKVKQLTGKKPIDLLKSYRMKKAKELLSQQKLTVAEVAYKVGFDLPNSFSRSFKKEYGMSPTQFITQLSPEDALV